MQSFLPADLPLNRLHQLMLGSIAPRPIALVATTDELGNHNLSPFSFYNAFGINPTTLIFSPSRRGRDNTTKDTYTNVKHVPEVVINAVSFSMVQQVSLASTEYPKGTDEFIKSGLTPIPSLKVRPLRVAESPVQYECVVRDIIETGSEGGAGNLVICEILMIHVSEHIFDAEGLVDPHRMDLVGRLGGDYYCRASGDAVFQVEKPLQKMGIGVDRLPEEIRLSNILTGNDLGRLGNLESLPTAAQIKQAKEMEEVREILLRFADKPEELNHRLQGFAKLFLERNKPMLALSILLAG